MNISVARLKPTEQVRISSLIGLAKNGATSALDVGARDGYLSSLLANKVERVVALDLLKPVVDDPRIICVEGDASALSFRDEEFEIVLCAEVLEHIPEPTLSLVCKELVRVTSRHLIIGVPLKQDLRLCRSTCGNCGSTNPPWGHVNSFDEKRLAALFAPLRIDATEYIGKAPPGTNFLSAWLMDFAGNPFGTYEQDEACCSCSKDIGVPMQRTVIQRVATRVATLLQRTQAMLHREHANWIHIRFSK